jgi:starch-binding outer membrane protein, SusD/RagB family
METTKWIRAGVVAGVALFAVTGCDLLEVTNPGEIDAAGLENASAIPGLVVGMSGDLSFAFTSVANLTGVMSHEWRNGDSRRSRPYFDAGQIPPEEVNGIWSGMHRARWVAETGDERIRRLLGDQFDSHPLAPMPSIYAGFSNRILGEQFCFAVIDGGDAQASAVHLSRAEAAFTEALRLAQAQGRTDLAHAARAGRAQVRAGLGNWTDAAADAALVPVDFVFNAVYSANSSRERNDMFDDTHVGRTRFTVWGTEWEDTTEDPRVPWRIMYDAGGDVATTYDGNLPAYQQLKYTSPASPIALARGTEMLLIRAEERLRANALEDAVTLINEQRAHYGLGPVEVPAGIDEGWILLQSERGAVLWLEGRRLGDLRRWFAEDRHDFLENRDRCVPISQQEQESNPNL